MEGQFGGLDVSEAKRLRQLEDENAKLKKLLAEQMLDAAALRSSIQSLDDGERHKVKRIMVKAGGRLSLQMHHQRSEHWIVMRATARVIVQTTRSIIIAEIYDPRGASVSECHDAPRLALAAGVDDRMTIEREVPKRGDYAEIQ